MRAFIKVTLIAALAALTAQAKVLPYSSDANTLQLWHLEVASGWYVNSADASTEQITPWAAGLPDRAATGPDGLSNACEMDTAATGRIQSQNTFVWTNQMMGANGAFTWEMALKPNKAIDSNLGGASTKTDMIMATSGADITLQLKIVYAADGTASLSLYKDSAGESGTISFGLNTGNYTTNEWHHLAVTYDGAGEVKLYWTNLSDYDGTMSLAQTGTWTTDFDGGTQVAQFAGNGATANVFDGAIDEIRISDIARAPTAFLQQPPPLVPYTADSDTLQLFHMEETSAWYQNEVSASTMKITPWTAGSSQRDIAGTSGMGYAFQTDPTVGNRLESESNEVWSAQMMGPDGAFTWEMLLKPNKAIDSNNGGGAADVDQIMITSGAGTTLQLKTVYGTAGTASLTLYKTSAGETPTVQFDLTGSNYTPGEWHHLAVVYDGNENTAGNIKIYWTPVDGYNGTATVAKTGTWTEDFDGGTQKVKFAGNTTAANVFDGAVDEIRISSVARADDEFLQFLVETVTAFPAVSPLLGDNLIPNGDFASVSSPSPAIPANDAWNITGTYGDFGNFTNQTATLVNWSPYYEDPNSPTTLVSAVGTRHVIDGNGELDGTFYLDTLISTDGDITLNSVMDYRNGLQQEDILNGVTVDAGKSYMLLVDALCQTFGTPEAATFTAALTDETDATITGASLSLVGTNMPAAFGTPLQVEIDGSDLLAATQVNVLFDSINTTAIPGFPGSVATNDVAKGALVAQVKVASVTLAEILTALTGDLNHDGVVDDADIAFANSYLDGSVDSGDTAAERQDYLINRGTNSVDALDQLNLTEFDIDGDGTFDADDVTAIDNFILPIIQMGSAAGLLNFEWNSSTGKVYDLEATASLVTTNWVVYNDGSTTHADIAADPSGTNTLTDVPVNGDVNFFRILKKDAP